MSLIYPNIVPDNDLRLPGALTIKHGPARLLSRFVLEGDKTARRQGIRLRFRHDFEELLYLNKQQTSLGNWFRLLICLIHNARTWYRRTPIGSPVRTSTARSS